MCRLDPHLNSDKYGAIVYWLRTGGVGNCPGLKRLSHDD